jgi:hypothetical protein
MEAYLPLRETRVDIKEENVVVDHSLPGSITARVMKPENYPEKYMHHDVWVEIDTANRIIVQWPFNTLEEAEAKWREVSSDLQNGKYKIVLRVDGGKIDVQFTGKSPEARPEISPGDTNVKKELETANEMINQLLVKIERRGIQIGRLIGCGLKWKECANFMSCDCMTYCGNDMYYFKRKERDDER